MPDLNAIEDRFADALDALVLGIAGRDDEPLARLAADIQRVGGQPDAIEALGARLDRATKTMIWADLMREQGGRTTAPPLVPVSGGSGSTLAPNPWAPTPARKPRRRPSPAVLRFVPDAQPFSTFLLIVAVMVLIGATFATLSPDNRRGFLPSASATENAPALAATPDATPDVTTGTCDVTGGMYSWAPETPYEYEPVGMVAPRTIDALGPFFGTFSACMAPDVSRVGMFASERFMREFRYSLEGTPPAGIEDRIAEMAAYWTFSLAGQQGVQSYVWEGSGMGEPQRLHLFPETAREMADGRLGVLISITPAGVSLVPDQSWIDQATPGTYAVFLVALGTGFSDDPDFGIDEMIGHCGGADCVPMYGADAAPQPPAPTNGSTPLRIRIEAADVDVPVDEQDTFTGPIPIPGSSDVAGWFVNSAGAGGTGNMVITGYANDGMGSPAAFQDLESVPPGSTVEVIAADGKTYIYAIDAVSPRLNTDDPAYEEKIAGYIDWPVSDGEESLSIVAFGLPQTLNGDVEYLVVARAVPLDTAEATPIASPVAAPE